MQVYSLKTWKSSDFTCYPLVTGPAHSCAISTPRRAYSPAAVSAHWTYRRHWHVCPTRYSFSPESSEAFESEVRCPRTQHLNNVPRLRGEKHDISLKILHQAGFETARQATTLAKLRALTTAVLASLWFWLRFWCRAHQFHLVAVVLPCCSTVQLHPRDVFPRKVSPAERSAPPRSADETLREKIYAWMVRPWI